MSNFIPLNVRYRTLALEQAHRGPLRAQSDGISLAEANEIIKKNRECREDKEKPVLSILPDGPRRRGRDRGVPASANHPAPSATSAPLPSVATAPVASAIASSSALSLPAPVVATAIPTTPQPADMAPPAGRNDKKAARDTGRSSISRNTTPNSVAGASAAPVSGKSPHFGAPILEPLTFKPVLDTIPPTPNVPDSNNIEHVDDHSTVIVTQASTSVEGFDVGVTGSHELHSELVVEKDRVEQAAIRTHATKKTKPKPKRKKPTSSVPDRPLTHGAHAVAAQDGSHVEHALRAPAASRDPDTASSSLSPAQTTPAAAAAGPDQDVNMGAQDDDSMDEVQPFPTRVVVEAPTFGDDPSTFDDPTVYEIRKIRPDMSAEEIKDIASVADYPRNDLSDLIAGSPPDKDFSNAKPANQVQSTTFAAYVEPYLRPFNEDDAAFLKERGDRHTPYIMPSLGKKHYKEVWAEEDGVDVPEEARPKYPSNEARGSMEDMNDAIAETDELSTGPVMSRLMSLYRHEHRQVDDSAGNSSNAGNGEEEAGDNDDLAAILEGSGSKPAASRAPFPPATRIPEPAGEPGKKYEAPKLSASERDARAMEELAYIGLVPPNAEPNYASSADDQNAAMLRELQARLKVVTVQNGARKRIMQSRMPDLMAHQEFSHIKDDLDNQVTSNYQKRSRTQNKKQKKRSGGAGGGANAGGSGMIGVAKPGLEGATKTAMDRRKNWDEKVGPVFKGENLGKIPKESIFTPEAMAEFMAIEAAAMEEDDAEDD